MRNRARASPSSATTWSSEASQSSVSSGIDVGQLVLELVEVHGGQLGINRRVVSRTSGSQHRLEAAVGRCTCERDASLSPADGRRRRRPARPGPGGDVVGRMDRRRRGSRAPRDTSARRRHGQDRTKASSPSTTTQMIGPVGGHRPAPRSRSRSPRSPPSRASSAGLEAHAGNVADIGRDPAVDGMVAGQVADATPLQRLRPVGATTPDTHETGMLRGMTFPSHVRHHGIHQGGEA